MNANPVFLRLFDHAHWANLRLLDALAPEPDERALRVFAHLLAAERVWLMRLSGHDTSAEPIWPERSLAACGRIAAENARGYRDFLEAAGDDALDRSVAYRNSKGTAFETSVRDILTHVALHGAYHRGHIAASMRGAGAEPASTDFILYVREG
jgi:uncharacterized damage-inducible protein DinB